MEGNITSFDPKLGSIPGIQVSGPQVQQSFQSVNGRQRNYTTYVYMVMPQQTGKYPIGPFEFVDGSGTKRELKAVTLNVLAPGATRNSAAGAAKISDLLQLELLPSKSEVYPQEVFDLTFQLYYRQVNPADDFQLRDFSAPGMDIEQPTRLGSVRQERDGVLWNVIRWRAKAKALRTGAFEITPTMTVGLLTDAGGDDDFFLIRPAA
ncbi:MAG: BatD family protein [Kiritimatiellia bacterium]